jgi:hypothetical protein
MHMTIAKWPWGITRGVLMALIAVRVTTAQAPYPKWPFDAKYDSVKAAPKNYKLLYEDEKLRFIEVTINPGETTPMSGHPYPAVYLHDGPMPDPAKVVDTKLDPNSPLNGQGAGHGTAPKGMNFPTCDTMAPLAPHQVTNKSDIPIHYWILEFKRLDGTDLAANWKTWYPWMVPPIPEVKNVDTTEWGPPFSKEFPYSLKFDPVKAAPNNHKALYTDSRIRLVEVTERPESQENLHGHAYRSVFINDVVAVPTAGGGQPPAGTVPAAGAAPARPPAGKTPLGRPGPYHKGESGDYVLDPNEHPMGRGTPARPPAGMIAPSCTPAEPQAPHAHINGGPVPGHFYRAEFFRPEWNTPPTAKK